MSKITIELTEKVAFEFLDKKLEFLEVEHLPYKEFDLKFPMSVYLSEDKVLSDTLSRLPVPKESLTDKQLKMMKKVWIEEHTKGKKEEAQDLQEYRITRIDE